MSIPGTILSQFGTMTSASNGCASAMTSMLSAISSLEQREYFIPSWPIAIPSHTPMTGNSTGCPPASLTPAFTASTMRPRCMCPGTISLCALTIPTIGMFISLSVQPSAFIRDLMGAFSIPFFMLSLLIRTPHFMLDMTASPISTVPHRRHPSV